MAENPLFDKNGVKTGYFVEFKRGWWTQERGKDARHENGPARYRGSVTEEQAKELERIVYAYLDSLDDPARSGDGDAKSQPRPDDLMLMPRKLTAENGMKGAMIGEFQFRPHEGADPVYVPWDTIKQIYDRAVMHLGRRFSVASATARVTPDFVLGQLDKDIEDAIHGLPTIWRSGFKERFTRLLRKAIDLCNTPPEERRNAGTVYLVGGKHYRMCDCPKLEGKCPLGVERTLQTTQLSQCLIPAEGVLIA